jgi:uncharacterized protein
LKGLVRRLLLLVAAIALFLAGWAFWWEPRRLVVREHSLALDCWAGPPLRIAVVSDLHIGSPYVGIPKLERLVAEINEGRPDLVVLLGDFVIQGVKGGRFVPPEQIASRLALLEAKHGVYAVLGNHDWWLDAPRVARAFRSVGIHVLEDAAAELPHGKDGFWLAGISDFTEGKHDVAAALRPIPAGAPVIAITHNPDVFPHVPKRVCLTLAGHTHGGQVAFPVVGRPIVPSIYGETYAIGHVHEKGRNLFVTAGVGTSIIPVRFRVPPEIVFLTVKGAG